MRARNIPDAINRVRRAIIKGVQANGDRIFDLSQQFCPVKTGTLKHSGDKIDTKSGFFIIYKTSYACIPYLHKQYVRLANGGTIRANKLRPGDLVDDGYGNAVDVIAVVPQPLQPYRILKITTESGKEIIVTDNHKLSVGNGRFIEAGDLQIGNSLETLDDWKTWNLIKCEICGQTLRKMSVTHLNRHGISASTYIKDYGPWTVDYYKTKDCWSKGLTKDDPRVAKFAGVFKGHKHSDAARNQMKANHWSKRGIKPANYKEELHKPKRCGWCDVLFDLVGRCTKKVFCSNDCHMAWRRERFSGKNNPRYGKPCLWPGTTKHGYREDLGHYVRSSWEANFARLLKTAGYSYYYEPERFDLGDGRTYCPDFFVPSLDLFIEIKGLEKESPTRYDVAAQRFLDKRFCLIDGASYYALERKYAGVIDGWEKKE